MKYKYLIFDVDDTLLDFNDAYHNIVQTLVEEQGIQYSNETFEVFQKCGWNAWNELHLYDTDNPEIQDSYHELYIQYLTKTFDNLKKEWNITRDSIFTKERYLEILSRQNKQIIGALSTYKQLSKNYRNVIATNGIELVQLNRLKDFLPNTYKVFVSETINKIKPDSKFYEYILRTMNCKPEECLMIGDSLTNDMLGASKIGIDTCWYNPKCKVNKDIIHISYEIQSIQEMLSLDL
jgi:HAD superfamily hydrolase (TIGR01549 family)